MLDNEIWKSVEGFEGYYAISNHGRIKSFIRSKMCGRVLKMTNKKGWYLAIVLKNKETGNVCTKKIHRLVGFAFVPGYFKGAVINHKDTNKQNNYYKNLEWVTQSDNCKHAVKNTQVMVGFHRYNKEIKVKAIEKIDIENGDVLDVFKNGAEAAKATGICHRNILQVASKDEYKPGKIRKQAGGFSWKYMDIKKWMERGKQ